MKKAIAVQVRPKQYDQPNDQQVALHRPWQKGVKQKKRDMQEEKLLQQAIDCMEQKKKSSDEDDILVNT